MHRLTKLLLAVSVVFLVGIGWVTLFGDCIRNLFGMSTDALAGNGSNHLQLKRLRHLSPVAAERLSSPAEEFATLAFTSTREDPLSTFGLDVDTASYTIARSLIRAGRLPSPESVRLEEYVNYFRYDDPAPERGTFALHFEGAPSPFQEGRHLVRLAVKGREVPNDQRKPAHLVFLVDVSGSMAGPTRLGLAKKALGILVRNLNERDTVALVTYAGGVRDVLPPTSAAKAGRILEAIESLSAGGSTAMGSGLELAYAHALAKVSPGSVSRVLVLSDGDANVGANQTADQMLAAVQGRVAEGVTLTTVGFGMGNYRDALMERLADKGNGNCFYLDSEEEARRLFSDKLAGTLEVIARDVKVQVEWNPRAVKGYRLLGYENRAVADRDFRDDRVDGGEVGAGHQVTALYEVELTGDAPGELASVRIRAKRPDGGAAQEQQYPLHSAFVRQHLEEASADFRFAAAVAGAAEVFRAGGDVSQLEALADLARGAAGERADRREFVALLGRARQGGADPEWEVAQGY